MNVRKEPFGELPDGRPADLYTLTNDRGLLAQVTTYGAILVSLQVPDRHGRAGEITLGFDTLGRYLGQHPHFGGTIGRVANRLAHGRFALDGRAYQLERNWQGAHHLHGGTSGFDRRLWSGQSVEGKGCVGVRLTYHSPDGEEGYPGALGVEVTYALTDADELRIDYRAAAAAPTIVNLTNHAYFNLADAGRGTIHEHVLELYADAYLPTDELKIPTGEVRPVAGTPLDFTRPTPVGQRIEQVGGYDHCYVVRNGGRGLVPAARVSEPASGRVMVVETTEPGVQFYTGNVIPQIPGRGDVRYGPRHALCLETQRYPDAPNHPEFPSIVLRPGEVLASTTVHRFSAE